MPVEIRELLVKTTIESNSAAPSASAPAASGDASSPGKSDNGRSQDRLLKECVNMIMDNISTFTKER